MVVGSALATFQKMLTNGSVALMRCLFHLSLLRYATPTSADKKSSFTFLVSLTMNLLAVWPSVTARGFQIRRREFDCDCWATVYDTE